MKKFKAIMLGSSLVLLSAGVSAGSQLPSNHADIQRAASIRPITRTASLPALEKLEIVKAALAGKVPMAQTMSLDLPVKVDVRNAFIEGKARLYFNYAMEVSAAENVANFSKMGNVDPR